MSESESPSGWAGNAAGTGTTTGILSAGRLALLRELRQGAPPVAAADIPVMVPIRPLGTRAPLFWPAPVSGSSYVYTSLVSLLDPRWPAYGFDSPGLHGTAQPLTTVGEMAQHYLGALLARQPREPYLLIGYSMGGTIAFEMAARLAEGGSEVALVVLIDATIPQPEPPASEPATVRRFITDVAGAVGRDLGDLDLGRIAWSDPERDPVPGLFAVLSDGQLIPRDVGIEFVRRRYAVFRANMHALQAYDPAPYPGAIVTIRASASIQTGLDWRRFAIGGVEDIVMAGDHYSIWSPPRLPALAARLGECLRTAAAD